MSVRSMGKDDYEANPRKDEIEDIGKPGQAAIYDDVFGDISEGGPNYRDVSCCIRRIVFDIGMC